MPFTLQTLWDKCVAPFPFFKHYHIPISKVMTTFKKFILNDGVSTSSHTFWGKQNHKMTWQQYSLPFKNAKCNGSKLLWFTSGDKSCVYIQFKNIYIYQFMLNLVYGE